MSRTSYAAGRATIDSPRVGDARAYGGGGDRTISAVGAEGPIGAPAIPPQAVGAAVSKLISATIGEIAVIFSRSPAHKHHTFADLEWMVLSGVLTGQVYVAEMMHKENGACAPVAVVLWASVSAETDKRLSENPGHRPRLRPDEWKGGDQLWIIDLAGEPAAVAGSLRHLAANEFKDRQVKMLMRDPEAGEARVVLLAEATHIASSCEKGAATR